MLPHGLRRGLQDDGPCGPAGEWGGRGPGADELWRVDTWVASASPEDCKGPPAGEQKLRPPLWFAFASPGKAVVDLPKPCVPKLRLPNDDGRFGSGGEPPPSGLFCAV